MHFKNYRRKQFLGLLRIGYGVFFGFLSRAYIEILVIQYAKRLEPFSSILSLSLFVFLFFVSVIYTSIVLFVFVQNQLVGIIWPTVIMQFEIKSRLMIPKELLPNQTIPSTRMSWSCLKNGRSWGYFARLRVSVNPRGTTEMPKEDTVRESINEVVRFLGTST